MSATYILPCGYIDPENPGEVIKSVEMQEMTGHEEDLLADQSKQASGDLIDEVVARCIVKLGSIERPRPSRDKFFMKHVQSLLMTDKTFLLIRLRQLSLGDDMVFSATCPSCKHNHPRVTINLNDLKVTEMEDPTQREWTITLPASKKVVTLKAMDGIDGQRARKLMKQNKSDLVSAAMFVRVKDIDGKKLNSVSELKNLSVRDRDYIRQHLTKGEGGIDTTVEVQCEACAEEWKMGLPVGDISFFFPSGMRD